MKFVFGYSCKVDRRHCQFLMSIRQNHNCFEGISTLFLNIIIAYMHIVLQGCSGLFDTSSIVLERLVKKLTKNRPCKQPRDSSNQNEHQHLPLISALVRSILC